MVSLSLIVGNGNRVEYCLASLEYQFFFVVTYNIPPKLIINGDQTRLPIFTTKKCNNAFLEERKANTSIIVFIIKKVFIYNNNNNTKLCTQSCIYNTTLIYLHKKIYSIFNIF